MHFMIIRTKYGFYEARNKCFLSLKSVAKK